MHKEVVVRKKVMAIIVSVFLITISLYTIQFIDLATFHDKKISQIIKTIVTVSTMILLAREIKKCSVSYKYSIIADKLIINKISHKAQENVESIKIEDIVYLGKEREIPKSISKCRKVRNYFCDRFSKKKYTCIYRIGNVYSRFNFEPSDCFIRRLEKKR